MIWGMRLFKGGFRACATGIFTLFIARGLPYAFVPSRNTGFVLLGRLPRDIDWGFGFIRGENEYLFDKTSKMGIVASGTGNFQNVKNGIYRVENRL
jgi:hypothetical protein